MSSLKRKVSNKKTIFWRVYLSFFLMTLLAIGILTQIFRLQVVEGKKWRSQADSLTTKFVEVEPNRGNIYASDGSLLATSLSIYDLHMDLQTEFIKSLKPSQVEDSLLALAEALAGKYKGEGEKTRWLWNHYLNTAYKNRVRYLPIRNNVSHIDLKDVQQFPLFRLGQFKGGLIVEQKSIRKRPFKRLAQRTIGYKRPNLMPVGLEGAFDNYLGGVKGKRLLQKVGSRTWIPINDRNELEPVNGQDIYTTIDINIQDYTEKALLKHLEANQADHGCAIVMEVATGKIRAIANLGKADQGEGYWEKYNYAIGESTQPGSTFKIASLMALLEHGHMLPEDTVATGEGSYTFFDQIMYDSKYGGYGTISLRDVIKMSSNIGIAKCMQKYYGSNHHQFTDFLKSMHVHEPTGVPIVGEEKPYIKSPDSSNWSGTTLAWMSHGYELELTPLQTLMIYNVVANSGRLMQPLFVTEVRDVNDPVQRFKPRVLADRIISEKTAKTVADILESVISEDGGTAHSIYRPGMPMAGKTGTAVLNRDEEGNKQYQASFAGFFPADNPKYSCIVVVNDPKEQYYGGDVAAPIFREIADKIYSYDVELNKQRYAKKIRDVRNRPTFLAAHQSDLSTIYTELEIAVQEQKPEGIPFVEPKLKGNTINWVPLKCEPGGLPDVRGLSLSDALYVFENLGLEVQYTGSGNVYRQVPSPGTPLVNRTKVYINLN